MAGESGEGAEDGGPVANGHPGVLFRCGMGQMDDVIIFPAHA